MKSSALAAILLFFLFTSCSTRIQRFGTLYPPDFNVHLAGNDKPLQTINPSSTQIIIKDSTISQQPIATMDVPIDLKSGPIEESVTGLSKVVDIEQHTRTITKRKILTRRTASTKKRFDWSAILFPIFVVLALLCFFALLYSFVMLLLAPFSITAFGLQWYWWLALIGGSAGLFLAFGTIAEALW